MSDPKLLGKFMIVEWLPDGEAVPISIATKSRNFSVDEKGNEIDVSVREDIAANQRDTETDAPTRTAELSGLDTAVDAPDWEARIVGELGTLTWYRRGKTSGRPSRSCSAVVTSNGFKSPYDNANDWSIAWGIKSVITTGVVT